MTTSNTFPIEFPQVLSSSMRESLSLCPRKFYWEQIRGYTPKGESEHLIFGAAYAKGLEVFRLSYYGDKYKDLSPNDRCAESLADAFFAATLEYGSYDPPEGSAKTYNRLIGAIIEYILQYAPENDPVKPSMFQGRPRVEFSFTFEIPGVFHPATGNPLLFTGRSDMLAEFQSGVFIFDDKTTGALGPTWAKQWALRSQFTAYTVGAQESNLPVLGAIIRGIAILKTKYNIAECITHRPPHIVEAWKERLVYDAKRLLEMWHSGYWPQQGQENGGCSQYGGCPYQVLCESIDPEPYLDVYFRKGRYDPVAREVN